MKKVNVSRRDFIKATAATTVVAAAALTGKEVLEKGRDEASLDDLEVVEQPVQMSCLDLLKGKKA